MSHLDEAEKDQLVKLFESFDVKPKLDDAESLHTWMQSYLKGKGRLDAVDDTSPAVHTKLIQPPRITPFSGSGMSNEINYETWKFEIRTLQKDSINSKAEIETALKKALRGEAANTVRRLGLNATVTDIIYKLDGIYGAVENSDDLLTEFFKAEQKLDEKVARWGCRIEDLLDRARQQEPLKMDAAHDMLRCKFWKGLQSHLKEASRHIKDRMSYDELLVAVRKIEGEDLPLASSNPAESKKGQVKAVAVVTDTVTNEMKELRAMLCAVTKEVKEMKDTLQSSQHTADSGQASRRQGRGLHRGRGRHQHQSFDTSHNENQQHYQSQWNRPYQRYPQPQQHSQPQQQYSQPSCSNFSPADQQFVPGSTNYGTTHNQMGWKQQTQYHSKFKDIECYRCGVKGHYARNCLTDLHNAAALNMQESM